MGCAVRTVVAVDHLSTVAFVCVDIQCALVDLKVVFRNYAVEGICAAGQLLASIAVAGTVKLA